MENSRYTPTIIAFTAVTATDETMSDISLIK
jgi:hypothetical protein